MSKSSKLKITGIMLIILAFGIATAGRYLLPRLLGDTSAWDSIAISLIKAVPAIMSIVVMLRGVLDILKAKDLDKEKKN